MALALYKGFSKGFIIGIFSFIAYFVGLAAALKLSTVVAAYISGSEEPSVWMPVLSFALVFIVVVLAVNLVARLIRKIIKAATLGWLDRLGGILLFILVYTFIFSTLLFYANQINWIDEAAKESSKTYAYVAPVAPFLLDSLGNIFPVFQDLFGQLQTFFENLDKKI